MAVDADSIDILVSLARSGPGRAYIEYLRKVLADLDKKSRRLSGDELLINNGRRQQLEEELGGFDSAIMAVENKKKNIPTTARF